MCAPIEHHMQLQQAQSRLAVTARDEKRVTVNLGLLYSLLVQVIERQPRATGGLDHQSACEAFPVVHCAAMQCKHSN